jgi:peptidoglycan biosynthesis protein MviN/MurJ (putative lipid II flippase)
MKPSRVDRSPRGWRAIHPNHRKILRGVLSVGAFVMAAKLVAAAKEIAVAARYGVSGVVDSYMLAFTIATWLPTIVVSVGTMVLVPRLVALPRGGSDRAGFLGELNGTVLMLGLALVAITAVAGPLLVPLMSVGLSSTSQAATRAMVIQMAPMALLTLAAGLMAIRLQSTERHSYTLAEAAPALGVLIFVSLSSMRSDPQPLVLGTLAGAAVQVVWCSRMSQRAEGTLGGLSLQHRSAQWAGMYGALSVMAIGSVAMGLTTPVDQLFAARVGEGSVAALGYANRVISLLTGLGAVAMGRALLPVLSDAAASGQFELGRTHAVRWAWLMLGAGSLTAAIGWKLAPWGVSLLFERGSFSAADTDVVARILRASLLQLPFYFAGIVLVQWISVLGRFRVLLYVAIAAIAIKAALNAALIHPFGTAGIALSTAAMYALSFLMQMAIVRRSGQ